MLKHMRNIGITAHIDAGKTTTTERILYYTGKIHRIGEIDDGAATMDWMPQEQERGITIQSAATTTYWRGCQINIIDTPGHVDFTAEVERSLRVLDGAVAVLCAVGAVQSQTETVWRQADDYGVPRLIFVNKMDRVGADFAACIADVEAKFTVTVAPLQIPIGEGSGFEGVIDLVDMEEIRWTGDGEGETMKHSPIHPTRAAAAAAAREKLIDRVASFSDAVADAYLEGGDIDRCLLVGEIRRLTIDRSLIPALCGAARRNTGVQPLIDAVVDYLPAPDEVPPAKAFHLKKEETIDIPCESTASPLALVFKIQYDREVGSLCYVRVYSGRIKNGDTVYNTLKKKRERVTRLFRMHANKTEALDSVEAGDIAVIVGLKLAQTGDTLGNEGLPVLLEKMHFPEPVITVNVESATLGDRDKLKEALALLSKEDPTFRSADDDETGQLLISGMGELHLEVLLRRIKDDFHLDVKSGNPRVTYRESVTAKADHTEIYEKVLAGKLQAASVTIHVESAPQGSGNSYECTDTGAKGSIPPEIFNALEQAVIGSFSSGIRLGYPCIDIKAAVTALKYDELTATTGAFSIAAAAAFAAACEKAAPALFEPIMAIDIVTPKEFLGDAMNQITSRSGTITGTDSKTDLETIHAEAPMSKMFGFSTTLRSVSKGRATFTMEFSHFAKAASNAT